jgi:hypothetical protein
MGIIAASPSAILTGAETVRFSAFACLALAADAPNAMHSTKLTTATTTLLPIAKGFLSNIIKSSSYQILPGQNFRRLGQ